MISEVNKGTKQVSQQRRQNIIYQTYLPLRRTANVELTLDDSEMRAVITD